MTDTFRYLKRLLFIVVVLFASCSVPQRDSEVSATPAAGTEDIRGRKFHNITLETSLKPFRKNDQEFISRTAEEIFRQWSSLLRHADTVSVMLWTSDGSEILDYSGRRDQKLEWARYIGNPNTQHPVGSGPEELSLHERAYLYMQDPPEFTYGDLARIVEALKKAGRSITGKPIRIGTTFDPGPEFAKSEFKYKKHPEILEGSAMGHKSFVFSYATLKADSEQYAGFPEGIPDNTPFGTFFGRQSQAFMTDLGFDYIWFSNGFGFGMEPWSSTGTIFTGKGFDGEKLADTREKILNFWSLFRKECPSFRIETRGTNLSTGIDLAKDGVDLQAIYEGDFNILPPPNSPWAALDGDFGLELAGYMSRMAITPDDRYIFRYYTHDPWWLNSPWLDRYGREPHDIYLPMAVARISEKGEVLLPTHLNFLTIDNSFGAMPKQVPDEVIPHILKARYDSPTAPGPVVWVYPFDEYHEWARQDTSRLSEIYYGDWFIRQAINNGFPLNTVVATRYFQTSLQARPGLYDESVILTVVPDAGSTFEKQLMNFISTGGKVMIYGPSDHISKEFAAMINLQNTVPLEGEFEVTGKYDPDRIEERSSSVIRHVALFSGGPLATRVMNAGDPGTSVKVRFKQGRNVRDVLWVKSDPAWKGGKVVYFRGTNSSHFEGGRLLKPDDPGKYAVGPATLRHALSEFGFHFAFDKRDPSIKSPVLTVSRSDNRFFLSGYAPNTTVVHRFKFPLGAPLLTGYDTRLENGSSTYSFPTAWNREASVFTDQRDGIVSCKEMHSGELGISRRLQITGLSDATVRVFADDGVDSINAYVNAGYPWKKGQHPVRKGDPAMGDHFVIENVTGTLVVSW